MILAKLNLMPRRDFLPCQSRS